MPPIVILKAAYVFIRAVSSPHATIPPPTPEYFLSQIVASGATIVYCVPSFVEVRAALSLTRFLLLYLLLVSMKAWAEDELSVQTLKKLKALVSLHEFGQ